MYAGQELAVVAKIRGISFVIDSSRTRDLPVLVSIFYMLRGWVDGLTVLRARLKGRNLSFAIILLCSPIVAVVYQRHPDKGSFPTHSKAMPAKSRKIAHKTHDTNFYSITKGLASVPKMICGFLAATSRIV